VTSVAAVMTVALVTVAIVVVLVLVIVGHHPFLDGTSASQRPTVAFPGPGARSRPRYRAAPRVRGKAR
jgi:hypothetical protein